MFFAMEAPQLTSMTCQASATTLLRNGGQLELLSGIWHAFWQRVNCSVFNIIMAMTTNTICSSFKMFYRVDDWAPLDTTLLNLLLALHRYESSIFLPLGEVKGDTSCRVTLFFGLFCSSTCEVKWLPLHTSWSLSMGGAGLDQVHYRKVQVPRPTSDFTHVLNHVRPNCPENPLLPRRSANFSSGSATTRPSPWHLRHPWLFPSIHSQLWLLSASLHLIQVSFSSLEASSVYIPFWFLHTASLYPSADLVIPETL